MRNVRAFVQEIYVWFENQKAELEKWQSEQKLEVESKEKAFFDEVTSFVYSENFKTFIEFIKSDNIRFEKGELEDECAFLYEEISLGTKRVKLPIPEGFDDLFVKSSAGLYDSSSKTIGVPVAMNIKNGEGILVEYRNENEADVLDGIHNYILNALRYSNEYKQIIYIDPVRYNNSSLGILQPLSVGLNSAIDSVPLSIEDIRKKLNSLIAQIN